MDEWVKLIRDVGFPAAVAGFVLWRLEWRLVQLTEAITQLRLSIYAQTSRTRLERDSPPNDDR